ncbi:MAG: hypothetical protein K0R54_3434 [Clostridiaceae bacterium]|nr:hypothetical protein [Clostridiaceae bacterium]
MNRFSHYFNESYGWDKLSKYLLIIGLFLFFSRSTMITGMVLVIYSTFRSISKNKYKRYQELRAFENLLLIVKREIYGLKIKFGDFRKYKIFKCPSCAQKLRVPRKKGKLTITCKKCGAEFKGKS